MPQTNNSLRPTIALRSAFVGEYISDVVGILVSDATQEREFYALEEKFFRGALNRYTFFREAVSDSWQ